VDLEEEAATAMPRKAREVHTEEEAVPSEEKEVVATEAIEAATEEEEVVVFPEETSHSRAQLVGITFKFSCYIFSW
jgi:hypothetical protein